MALLLTITDAGRAALVNADNTGAGPVAIVEIGVGSGLYASGDPTQTALVAEVKRLTTFAGVAVADDVIHVAVTDDESDAYSLGEFGLYTDAGVLFAVYAQPTPILEKTGAAAMLLAADVALASIDAASLSFGGTGFANPPSSVSTAGVVRLATVPATVAGVESTTATTPEGVAAAIGAALEGLTLGELAELSETVDTLAATIASQHRRTQQNIYFMGQN